MDARLPRKERLRSMGAVRRLFTEGENGFVYPFRYMFIADTAVTGGMRKSDDVPADSGSAQAAAENSAPKPAAGNAARECAAEPDIGVEVLFSVPKRYHKRANKRNLLRRRTKEAYRLHKSLLCGKVAAGIDLALVYSTKEILPYERIENAVERILEQVARRL